MEIGLYKLKYPARKLINGVLPLVENVNPNTISWLLIPVGAAIAVCLYYAANGPTYLFLIAALLSILRMFLSTLDGLMAEYFNKQSPQGEVINRLTPELCDIMYLTALTVARPEWFHLGLTLLAIAWLTSFAGLIGLSINKKIESVGPAGQTDRLALFTVFSVLAYFADTWHWKIDIMQVFLAISVIAGIITILIRLTRALK